MPQRNDDRLVPPVKTLRKRLSGVYRADGLSGPTRRYVLIVAMLVGLATLPTLAAIIAGSKELDEGSTGALDAPLLPPASSGPVQPFTPPTPAPAPDGARVLGRDHEQKSKPDDPRYARSTPPSLGAPARPSHHHRPDRSRHNSRHKQCEGTTRSSHGSHRAERHHHAEGSRANHRNSGVDRHHAGRTGHR